MSAAQTHPTVHQPARTGSAGALAFIALVALAIVAFAVGQMGLSVGGSADPAAVPAQDQAVRDHRLGEINAGPATIVRPSAEDSRLRRALPPVLTPEQRAQRLGEYWQAKDSRAGLGGPSIADPRLEAEQLQAAMRLQAAAAYYGAQRAAYAQGEAQRALALQAWADHVAKLGAQSPVTRPDGTEFRGR